MVRQARQLPGTLTIFQPRGRLCASTGFALPKKVQELSAQLRSHYNLGAIGGELSAELPFILMHPKPNMKKIMKADTMNDNTDYKAQYMYYTVDPSELLCLKNVSAQISIFFTSNG